MAIVLENNREIHQIPICGPFHHWRDCMLSALNTVGAQRFKEWLTSLATTNNLLRA
jgi:hypothetical protein